MLKTTKSKYSANKKDSQLPNQRELERSFFCLTFIQVKRIYIRFGKNYDATRDIVLNCLVYD